MPTSTIELRPNRELLDPSFNGYKLSLKNLLTFKQELLTDVHRAQPDHNQYSLLHAQLFGLHNHLEGETIDNVDYVYFVDSKFEVSRVSFNSYTNDISEIFHVWEIPMSKNVEIGQYNISLKFATETLAVISDGLGILYIVETNNRNEDYAWLPLFSDTALPEGTFFIIKDVVFKQVNTEQMELHCLLLSLQQDDANERFSNKIYWVTYTKCEKHDWKQTSSRTFTSKGGIYYCNLESSCTALYVVSDNGIKFLADSEKPVINRPEENANKKYLWSQTAGNVIIQFKLHQDYNLDKMKINTSNGEITVIYNDANILSGKLYGSIDTDLVELAAESDKLVKVTLTKSEAGLTWPEVIIGNTDGEYVVDSSAAAEIHETLAHLCSDSEISAQMGPTFNSEQVEECDFAEDRSTVFERLSCVTHEVTHKANISSRILLTAKLFDDLPPAFAFRCDVDACLWLPHGNGTEDFKLKHEGTLLAFGYIQASKSDRKFSVCAPDFSYSVICESNRHLFIYKQKKPVTSGELKNRTTGKRIETIGQQQVVTLVQEEVLGIHAFSTTLFILTTLRIYALKV